MNLVLFMTRGMSLSAWEANGSLSRELALYEALSLKGIRTSIISWGDKKDLAIAKKYPWLKVYPNIFGLPQSRYERLMPLLHAWPLMRASFIKSNQINGADCAYRCARLWNKPFIARCGYVLSEFYAKITPQQYEHAQCVEKEIYTKCTHGIVTTQEAKKLFVNVYDIDMHKISVIPNYIPNSFFETEFPKQNQESPAIITHVGRLAEQKNLFSLVEACVGLPIILRLIGDGPLKNELEHFALKKNVNVQFMGNVAHENLPKFLQESTIYTQVSHFEGHPKALIEAMACGCTVIGTNVHGISNIVNHEQNGLLCETDATAIRAAIEKLLPSPELRYTLGREARSFARKYSLQNIILQEIAQYEKLPKISFTSSLVAMAKTMPKVARIIARKIKKYIKEKLHISITNGVVKSDTFSIIKENISNLSSPKERLHYIFNLEKQLYELAGYTAIDYDNGVHTKHRHTNYHDYFTQRVSEGEKVLDIGCGNGFLAFDMASKASAQVTGIELQEKNIAIAKEKFKHPNVTYIVGDALKDVPCDEFETIVLSNVLEHIPQRVHFLRSIQEKLQPKRFLLRVPLYERDWRVPLKQEIGAEWRLDQTHYTEYTQEQFLCEMACAGLQVTDFQIRWSEIWCEVDAHIPFADKAPKTPTITVLMSVYNGENFLEECIISVLRQSYKNFIFLIIDDASSDSTPHILAKYKALDARIKIITNEKNLGLATSLNTGLEAIDTEFIARMDADDICLPHRLENQLAFMSSHKNISVVGAQPISFILKNGDVETFQAKRETQPAKIKKRTLTYAAPIAHPTTFIRTADLKSVSGYNTYYKYTQDYDLWLRIVEKYEIANMPTALVLQRSHSNAISQHHGAQQHIFHILALIASEHRQLNLPSPIEIQQPTIDLVEKLLTPKMPSYYVWLILLLRNTKIKDRELLIFKALELITHTPINDESDGESTSCPLSASVIEMLHNVVINVPSKNECTHYSDIKKLTSNADIFSKHTSLYFNGNKIIIPYELW